MRDGRHFFGTEIDEMVARLKAVAAALLDDDKRASAEQVFLVIKELEREVKGD